MLFLTGCMHDERHALLLQVASYTGDEEARLDVSLEYAASVDEASRDDTIGRRIILPIHLRFLPSLQVLSGLSCCFGIRCRCWSL
jgi:hypothetical protein